MSAHQDDKQGNNPAFVSEWMNTISNFWGAWGKSWMDASQNKATMPASNPGIQSETEEALQAYLKSFQAISEVFSKPESINGLLKGTEILPEVFFKIMRSSVESCFNLQTQMLDKAARIGAQTHAYQFENLDQEMFQAWTEIYQKEFQQYLKIPALGLNRFYIEHINEAQDAFNIFHGSLSEFLFLLYLPIKKSFTVIQEELADKAKKGALPESRDDYYNLWIKILEGHYMKLFQSPEYATVLNRTIDAMANFKSNGEVVLRDVLQMLSIPSQKELDELYKDLYMTKKELRTLKKQVKALEKTVGEK